MSTTPKLRSLPSPTEERKFVNRTIELDLIEKKLADGIQGERMSSGIVCFWGAFGMGKSWLLRELETRHARSGQRKNPGKQPTITARLDLNRNILPAIWQGDELNKEMLIRELWNQLGLDARDLGQASPDEWAEAFKKEVTALSSQYKTPIIMLDTVDDLIARDLETFFWLEQYLVEPLAMTDRVLFVFTSRGELRRWRRFQVRRRVHSCKLTAFDADTAGQEVKAGSEVSKALYRHAFGHPLFTERLGTILEERGVALKKKEADFSVEPSLLKAVLGEVINEILMDVPELPAKIARYASVLRWVSVEPIRFLGRELGIIETGHGDAYYSDRIGELQAHHLLYWNSDKNSYHSDPVLRQLLAYHLKLEQPEQFCAAHLAAFNFHSHHLHQYPQYMARYVPELAYHRTMLADCELLALQAPTLKAWWTQFLTEHPHLPPEAWAELAEALEKDTELKKSSLENYQYLLSEARKRIPKQ